MNNQYFSFWQNAMTDVFNPGKQTENFNNILNQTFSQIEEMSSSFKNFSRTDIPASPSDYLKYFNFSSVDYSESLNDFFKFFGLVSIDEYRSLIKKYEQLKEDKEKSDATQLTHKNKAANQGKTISSQKKKISTLEKTITSQKSDLSTSKKEVTTLKEELAKQEKSIASLEKKLDGISTKKKTASKTDK